MMYQPQKSASSNHHSLMTPDNSSPESSSSFPTSMTKIPCMDPIQSLYASDAPDLPLPELGDDLDEFFRQVEYSSSQNESQQRGIKREWWEASLHPISNNIDENSLCYQQMIPQNNHRQQRHHSIQFDTLDYNNCKYDINFNNDNYDSNHYYNAYHPKHQKRLASWAGLESA